MFINNTYVLLQGNFGFVINGLAIYLIILAPVAMYFLLRELHFTRFTSIITSIIYLVNPISFPNLFSYPSLVWAELYVFLPAIALMIIKYAESGKFMNLLSAGLLITAYIQIQTSPFLYNFRFVLTSLGILFIYSVILNIRLRNKKDILIARDLFLFLVLIAFNFLPLEIQSGVFSLLPGSTNSALFFNYHFRNVIFTYQSQNLFYAISGLVVYPNFSNRLLEGNGQEFFVLTSLWVLIVLVAMVVSFLRKGYQKKYLIPFSLTAILSLTFIVLVQSGLILFLFNYSSLLFLWEYPSYLEMPLVFVYVPLIANLFDLIYVNPNHNNDSVPHHHSFKNFVNVNYIIRNRKVISFIVAFTIFTTILVPFIHYGPSGFTPPSESTLPKYSVNLTSYFHDKEGNYKVLLVPFNHTDYTMMTSVLPANDILSVPASYQNHPERYANTTFFTNMYSDISKGNFSKFSDYLNLTFVKFIILFNADVPHYIIANLSSLQYMNIEVLTQQYTILSYANFAGAVVTDNPLFYEPSVVGRSNINTSSTELINNYNFSKNSTSWGWHTSDRPSNNMVNFSGIGMTINVFGNSSQSRQLTQTWQVVWTGPGATLNVGVDIASQNNSYSILYLSFHNNSIVINGGHFTRQAFYFKIPTNMTGEFSYNLTSPADAEYAYVGILTYNKSEAMGHISVRDFTLYNILSNNTNDYTHTVPYINLPLLTYHSNLPANVNYSIIRPMSLFSLIEYNVFKNTTFDYTAPTIGLHNATFNISRLLTTNESLVLELNVLQDSTLVVGNQSYGYKSTPYQFIFSEQLNHSRFIANVKGYVLVDGIWLLFKHRAASPDFNFLAKNDLRTTTVNFSGIGLAEVFIPSTDSFSVYGNVTVIQEDLEFSGFAVEIAVNGTGKFIAYYSLVQPKMILYNVLGIAIFVPVLLSLSLIVTERRKIKF